MAQLFSQIPVTLIIRNQIFDNIYNEQIICLQKVNRSTWIQAINYFKHDFCDIHSYCTVWLFPYCRANNFKKNTDVISLPIK